VVSEPVSLGTWLARVHRFSTILTLDGIRHEQIEGQSLQAVRAYEQLAGLTSPARYDAQEVFIGVLDPRLGLALQTV